MPEGSDGCSRGVWPLLSEAPLCWGACTWGGLPAPCSRPGPRSGHGHPHCLGSLAPCSCSLPGTHPLNLQTGCPASQTTDASKTEAWLTRAPLCPSLVLSAFSGDFLDFSHGEKSQELSNQEEQVKALPRGDGWGWRVGKAHSNMSIST